MDAKTLKKRLEKTTIYEKVDAMTCEELTGAYVILRDLENKANELYNMLGYIEYVKALVCSTHKERLEDMYREFYKKGENNVQH